jgi:hypothetical protein
MDDREESVGGSKARANHKRIRKYREVVAMAFSNNNPLDVELIAEANKAAERRGKSVQDTMRFLCVLTLKSYNKTLDGKSTTQSTDQEFDD